MRTSNYSGDEIQQQEKSELSVQPAEETFAGSFKAIVVAQVFQTVPIIQQSMRLVAGMSHHSMFLRRRICKYFSVALDEATLDDSKLTFMILESAGFRPTIRRKEKHYRLLIFCKLFSRLSCFLVFLLHTCLEAAT